MQAEVVVDGVRFGEGPVWCPDGTLVVTSVCDGVLWRVFVSSGTKELVADVGGGANAEQIRNAFKILMSDKNVKAVLINIFGGILRCDVLAQGVIAAVKELAVRVPIVIRMEGTNVEEGKRLLKESAMNFTTADSMDEGADKVVRLAG